MKSHLLSSLLFLGLSLSLPSTSIAAVKMMGAGNVTCKEWLVLRDSTDYFSAGNWVLGFLSATAWNTNDDILTSSKADSLFNSIDGYCSKNPKQTIADAAVEMANHMLDKTPAK